MEQMTVRNGKKDLIFRDSLVTLARYLFYGFESIVVLPSYLICFFSDELAKYFCEFMNSNSNKPYY